MKYSYKWLQELSGTTKSAQEVADMLIVHAFEVEEIIEQGKDLEHVVVGQVLTVQKHAQADKLNVATVDVGEEELTIVCGAPNLAVGQKVPVALIGATLPDGDHAFHIKKSKIRGIESHGMICATDELGLGGHHDGIMVLPEDAPVGEDFVTYYGLNDTVLDIDVLPNRAHDALGHRGMAREIAALEGRVLVDEDADVATLLQDALTQTSQSVIVHMDTPQCQRYSMLLFENIRIAPSPLWLARRLETCDMTPINNVVDLSNYMMLLYGQPTHAYDCARLQKKDDTYHIGVRQAQSGESLTLLDGQEITLHKKDLVITNGDRPIALAGIMGGATSAISDDTTSLLFEIAHFDAATIRVTKARYNLQTDAAYRFERDLDPNLVGNTRDAIVTFVTKHLGGVVRAHHDEYPHVQEPWTVTLPHQEIKRLLGVDIPSKRVEEILITLGIDVKQKNDSYICTIPTMRIDLTESADLIEEIGRIYGYDKITPQPLREVVQSPQKNEQRVFEYITKDFFVQRGYDEIKSYSFYGKDDAQAVGMGDEEHVTLINPMNTAQQYMRRTIIPGLLHATRENLSQQTTQQLFEYGRVYIPQPKGLPQEQQRLALSVTTKRHDGEQFFILKGDVEQYLGRLGIDHVYFDDVFGTDDMHVPDLHPSRRAMIKADDGAVYGVIGEVTKKTAKTYKLKNVRTAVCELYLDTLAQKALTEVTFTPLHKFPPVTRDVSMIVGARTRVADVERLLYDAGGELLQHVTLFDLYTDAKTQERSMAFHLTFIHPSRTLQTKEIDEIMQRIITTMEHDADLTVKK